MESLFDPRDIKIILALKNPGDEYEGTYHNVGSRVIERWDLGKFKLVKGKHFSYETWNGYTIIESTTYMNESGRAAAEALSYFKALPEELLVVHDDADLKLGEWKVEMGRGDAGHNGIKSIIENLGTKDFWRARIGIRKDFKDAPRKPAADFVLSPLSKEDDEKFIQPISNTLKELLGGGS